MNNIARSLIGLALTGATVAGVTLVAFPSQKKEQIDIEKQKLVARGTKRKEGLKLLEAVFLKLKDSNGNNEELAKVIDERNGSYNFFTIGENGGFVDPSTAESSMLSWCGGSQSVPEKFARDLNKELICDFVRH
ncbi:hypothetical protein A6V39_05360 [Candidatus Mycoplasma haematobovis]|uniref:Uncharacterized protein n=1 Tax=Candidatus Mycoplasma haematobovis TaxID=432608 RepID=A0A1A9QBC6_9MOLU|nr:hypothetical protein [Candidatus Mycoplasma haematobovis]OAL09763.1 hypothetical protein A6V39_05360 [Candidatus Mycoplasma haematobovis]